MKISIDKSRLALALLSLGALLIMVGLIMFVVAQHQEITTLQIKLHAAPMHPIAVQPTVAPTATPTAAFKFYPSKGVVK